MSWDTAVIELRTVLNDMADDRYCYRKKVFGDINGVNVSFKTFEFRRVTIFGNPATSAAPLGVYIGGVRLADNAIASDDPQSGEFTLVTPPVDNGEVVQATYYYQWFTDDELAGFLVGAARWLQLGSTYQNIPDGLTQAALYHAAKDALRKMAMRWTTRASSTFQLEDQPKKDSLDVAASYTKLASDYEKSALKYRDDFYEKSGQSLAAFSMSNYGAVSNVTPRQ